MKHWFNEHVGTIFMSLVLAVLTWIYLDGQVSKSKDFPFRLLNPHRQGYTPPDPSKGRSSLLSSGNGGLVVRLRIYFL